MKALTICQPYAEMIMLGDKRIENRTWPTTYRGPLLIHAGKSRDWLEADDEREYQLVFGAIVGISTLTDCLRVEKLPPELARDFHANGPFCWILADVERFAVPIPYRGAQGLWDYSGALPVHSLEVTP